MKNFWLFLQVGTLLCGIRVLLPLLNLNRIVSLLSLKQIPPERDSRSVHSAVRYMDALLRRIPSPARGDCLPRSLTLYYFANKYGFPVRLHCGVQRTGGSLKGHAWISLNGKPFFEPGNPEDTYSITLTFPR